jgi:hypothetical protein
VIEGLQRKVAVCKQNGLVLVAPYQEKGMLGTVSIMNGVVPVPGASIGVPNLASCLVVMNDTAEVQELVPATNPFQGEVVSAMIKPGTEPQLYEGIALVRNKPMAQSEKHFAGDTVQSQVAIPVDEGVYYPQQLSAAQQITARNERSLLELTNSLRDTLTQLANMSKYWEDARTALAMLHDTGYLSTLADYARRNRAYNPDGSEAGYYVGEQLRRFLGELSSSQAPATQGSMAPGQQEKQRKGPSSEEAQAARFTALAQKLSKASGLPFTPEWVRENGGRGPDQEQMQEMSSILRSGKRELPTPKSMVSAIPRNRRKRPEVTEARAREFIKSLVGSKPVDTATFERLVQDVVENGYYNQQKMRDTQIMLNEERAGRTMMPGASIPVTSTQYQATPMMSPSGELIGLGSGDSLI